jgi:hypothetical protein
VCPHELQEDRRWLQSQSVVLQEEMELGAPAGRTTRGGTPETTGSVDLLQEWVLGESHSSARGANRSHNVRWWESGSVLERYKEPVDDAGGYHEWLCASD